MSQLSVDLKNRDADTISLFGTSKIAQLRSVVPSEFI